MVTLNLDKIKAVHFGRANISSIYNLNGNDVLNADHDKDLGIIIDSKLNLTFMCVW